MAFCIEAGEAVKIIIPIYIISLMYRMDDEQAGGMIC